MDRVSAQQARRFLDRVVGFMVSPLLWAKIARGLSAGRVQSVAVKLIVEREREISAFKPEEFWEVHALLSQQPYSGQVIINQLNKASASNGQTAGNDAGSDQAIANHPNSEQAGANHPNSEQAGSDQAIANHPNSDQAGANQSASHQAASQEAVKFQVIKQDGKNFRPTSKEQTDAVLATMQGGEYQVAECESKPTRTRPSAPYITSTLQQAASTRLNFGVKKTMTLAQRLYEAGYITYMRTDSTNLSADAVSACRQHIQQSYGDKYLPDQPRRYASKDSAQEAHEAIRPSDVSVAAGQLKNMESDARRLYDLIWRQFVACQMPDAEYESTTVLVNVANLQLRVRGRVLKFDGYTLVQPPASRNDEEQQLPEYLQGQQLHPIELQPSQHFTKPPPRYGEASLVRELEKRGIGRPSTYASIISTIQERGYVSLQNKRFYAEKIGDIVTERLDESFKNLLDYGFTASLEESLDQVSDGQVEWKSLLNDFFKDFEARLETASGDAGMRANQPSMTDVSCEKCGRPMQIRTASTGVFLGCSGYSLPPKERCKHTVNLIPGDEVVSADADDEAESRLLRNKHRCQECGTAMNSYLIDSERKLHLCSKNPDCPGFEVEQGQFKIKGYDGPTLECDKCSADMQLKTGRFGKYFGCTNEDCPNTRKLLRNGEPAPPKMDPVPMPELRCENVDDTFVLRDGAAGIFLAASQFPKYRETRPPLVAEMLVHQNEIDPKYQFIMQAPTHDSKGRPSQVRFARKTKEHYVMTEDSKGKPTGWRADYTNGEWVVSNKPVARRKPAPKKSASRNPV